MDTLYVSKSLHNKIPKEIALELLEEGMEVVETFPHSIEDGWVLVRQKRRLIMERCDGSCIGCPWGPDDCPGGES